MISVEESLNILKDIKYIGLDTETKGLSPHLGTLLSVQLGNYENQVVVDCTTIDILEYKDLLESKDHTFLLWNAKFDIKWFYHKGIIIKNVYDGYLAEKLRWLGYPDGMHSLSLKTAAENYLSVSLDKSVRGQIIYKGLCTETIVYGANDVKYLELIKREQEKILSSQNSLKALEVENKFVKVLAYIEYCGVKLDINRWKAKMKRDEENYNECLKKLNDWVVNWALTWETPEPNIPDNFSLLPNSTQEKLINEFKTKVKEAEENNGKKVNPKKSKYVYINLQGDLFEGWDTTPKCAINWNSPKDVIPLMEQLGFNLFVLDKKTKEKKKSVEANVIKPQSSISSISKLYLDLKGCQKIISTYGQNILDAVNPNTGRIHPNFNQLMDTGRLSCGGGEDKDLTSVKGKSVSFINVQNLPSDEETRACFIAEDGNLWISADYSGEESVVLANISRDEEMLKVLNNGEDFHSLIAKICFPDILKDVPINDIKEKYHDLRKKAKGPEFTFAYGGDAHTLMARGFPKDEALEIENNYKEGFPGVAKYQSNQKKFVMDNGYIILCKETGHKAFIYDYDQLKETKKYLENRDFMQYYYELKETNPNHPDVLEVKRYNTRKAASERQSCNYPIQGLSAVIFKIFSIQLFNWIVKNNYFGIVKYCVPVHDEANLEAPKEIANKVADKLLECMRTAGKMFCKYSPLDATVNIDTHWVH